MAQLNDHKSLHLSDDDDDDDFEGGGNLVIIKKEEYDIEDESKIEKILEENEETKRDSMSL